MDRENGWKVKVGCDIDIKWNVGVILGSFPCLLLTDPLKQFVFILVLIRKQGLVWIDWNFSYCVNAWSAWACQMTSERFKL